MALLHLGSAPLFVKPISSSSSSNSFRRNQKQSRTGIGKGKVGRKGTPARDQVLDFGSYKGRMMGTVPSNYLTWLSKNVEIWGDLAKKVLADPVYQDRVEWDVLERFRSSDYLDLDPKSKWIKRTREVEDPIATMLEISHRFGWDNADTEAWENINSDLLGTSFTGRIPRKKNITISTPNHHHLPHKPNLEDDVDDDDDGDDGEVERKKTEKLLLKTQQQVMHLRKDLVGAAAAAVDDDAIRKNKKTDSSVASSSPPSSSSGGRNPFPGRGALLDRVKRRSG